VAGVAHVQRNLECGMEAGNILCNQWDTGGLGSFCILARTAWASGSSCSWSIEKIEPARGERECGGRGICSPGSGTFAIDCRQSMKRNNKLDSAAEQLLNIFEQHAQGLPAPERDARWHAFNRVAAKIDSSAKSRVKSKTLESPRVAQRHAEP
jgi:hypothetical protein